MKSHFPLVVSVFLCLIIVSLVSANDLTERARNGQFDQVTITYEQWIAEQEMSFPPVPSGWSLTDEGEPTLYWEPDDWEDEESDLHATVYLTHDGEGGGALTTLDATGGQYVKIMLGAAGNEEVAVYLDDVLLGTIAGEGATAQFDISWSEWTTSSVLKFIANGDQWTSSIVRSISLMASAHSGTPVAAFNGTPLSGMVPLEIFFTDESTGSPTSWFWDFGDGNPSTQQNPHHTFIAAGTYTVQLTVTNSAGNTTITKMGYIIVSEPAEMTIEIRDTDTSDLIPNAGVGLYDYTASEWQNLTTLSGTIIFRDSGSTHQYPLVIGNIYQVAASADGYVPVVRNVTFVENRQTDTVNLTKVEVPVTSIEKTYSMTYCENYTLTHQKNMTGCGKAVLGIMRYYLQDNHKWQEKFVHDDYNVTKADLGTQDSGYQGLDEATIHYHFGHGNGNESSHPFITLSNGDIVNDQDVAGKWNDKNKWVILHACEVLNTTEWGDALVTSHGILGFETEITTGSDEMKFAHAFFWNATYGNQTVYQSFYRATRDAYKRSGYKARVIFHNKDQADHDYLPGIENGVAPDGKPDDVPYVEQWQL